MRSKKNKKFENIKFGKDGNRNFYSRVIIKIGNKIEKEIESIKKRQF